MKNKTIYIIVSIVLIVILILFIYGNFFMAPYITNIEKRDSLQADDKVVINVNVKSYFFKLNKSTWCLLSDNEAIPDKNSSEWIQSQNGYCSFTKDSGDYYIFVKDVYGNITDVKHQPVKINKVLEINTDNDSYYLYIGSTDKINYELNTIGNVDSQVEFSSDDSNVVSVDNDGNIKGINKGNTVIKINSGNVTKDIKVYVTDYVNDPILSSNKPYISCGQFSDIDNLIIDKLLEKEVNKAGYGTRAGVVAAARFLTLQFSYRVHYFYENGRLNNYSPYFKVDGEGRYYHKGLYLSDSKKNDITNSLVGPKIWGCDLQNYTDWGPYVTGQYYPNGLDCSGFVTWALLNGGFDPGDIGAGVDSEHFDVTDLGERVAISNDLMNSGKVKVGDLIGLDGHTAIIAGWDDNNYYIAESLNTTGGVVITVVKRSNLVNNSIYKYIVLMDNFYKEDGNFTNIW